MKYFWNIIKFLFEITKFILITIGLLVVVYIVVGIKMSVFDDKDACLDSGYCKEGLSLNTENGRITINEQTCIENNGTWKADRKACQFKSFSEQ